MSSLKDRILAAARAKDPAAAREIATAIVAAAEDPAPVVAVLADIGAVKAIFTTELDRAIADTASIMPIEEMKKKGYRTVERAQDWPIIHLAGHLTEEGAAMMIKHMLYGRDGNDGIAGQITMKAPGNWRLCEYEFGEDFAVSTQTHFDPSSFGAASGASSATRSRRDSASERLVLYMSFIETSGAPEAHFDANGNMVVDPTVKMELPQEFLDALREQGETAKEWREYMKNRPAETGGKSART